MKAVIAFPLTTTAGCFCVTCLCYEYRSNVAERKTNRQKDSETERWNDKNTEREKEGMTKGQNDNKTDRLCHKA